MPGSVTESLDLDVPTLLLSPPNSVFPCKCTPSPSAAFILKVSEFCFLFLVLFFLPFPPPFLFFVLFFYHPCHNFVLEGTCFIIASFAHIETGTHP